MERNCPNCGAPKNGAKCEYCGTTFWEDQPILVADTPGFRYSTEEIIEKLSQWLRITCVINNERKVDYESREWNRL